ncbi:helix-turn-helix transcriptional regulator [Nocardioides sp. GCM10027113]|uniref:helix-turn-helix transcriptional regulator n=1 Tax=unclassified Nocardioides TaxID=2615069 RepID=UPI003623541F
MSGAKDQVARLLRLVPYLYARGSVRLDEAATDLGTAPAQLLRDLKVLFMCGLPGGYPDDLIDVDLDALEGEEGDGVIRVSNADYLARPLQLTATEATALIVALRALRNGASDTTREVVDRTLAKLEAAAQGRAEPRVDPGTDPVADEAARFLPLLERATSEGRQVEIAYYVPARDEESRRVVDPRGVVRAHGFSYLDAYCHHAEAPRLFRLDRIQEATVLDTPVQSEPAAPRDLADGIFQRSAATTVATLRLDPEAAWVVEYYAFDDVRRRPDGTLEADLMVADPRWLQRLLLRLAPHARVVAPAEVSDLFTTEARAALRLYT